MSDFAHLHVHSEYSILDGLGRQKDYLKKVQALGQPAIAFTEHGSLRGIYKLHSNLSKLPDPKPKPLYGCELYLCNDRHTRGLPEDEEKQIREANRGKGRKGIGDALFAKEKELGLRDRWHLTVIAENDEGLRNLYCLTSIGWLEGFWKRPRVDLETLDKYGDGLIILTGCMMGVVPNLIVRGETAKAVERMGWFYERFGDRLYLEIQPNSLPDQRTVNKAMARFAKHIRRPLVATADTHWIDKTDSLTHDVLLCINTHTVLSNPDRFRFSARDFWLKSRAAMVRGFERHHPYLDAATVAKSLTETVSVAERCSATIHEDKFAALIPSPGMPDGFSDEFDYLKHLCWVGWERRDIPERATRIARERGTKPRKVAREYAERLKYELSELKRKNVVRYFLVVHDLCNAARESGIVIGPGRGSAAGCFVSYLLGITDADPLEHKLMFERFLNPDRLDLPDCDLDFEDARRGEVVAYLRQKYGEDKVAHISTVTTMRGKGCIRDIGRVLEIPYHDVDACANAIVDNPTDEGGDIVQRAFEDSPTCREFNERYPTLLEHARLLDGHTRGLGIHAAGVIVSPVPLTDVVPVETRTKSGETVTVTGLEMDGCQALGLLKIDVLGLRNLTVIKHCLAEIEKRHGKAIDLDSINLNDPKVLHGFTKRHFTGVFQFDTQSAYNLSHGVEFETFDDVVALNALNRPGATRSGLANEWLKRKADSEKRTPIHPVVDRICADTFGVMVYQEHIIKILVEFGGFTAGEADAIRKKIAKSEGIAAIEKERKPFVKGAKRLGHDPAFAKKLFSQIAAAGQYSFNKSHACAYSIIALREMWLKTYYPHEFMLALLRCEKDTEGIKRCLKECRRLGVRVRGPNVNVSSLDFQIDDDTIVGSLVDVKGVGSIAAENIIERRGEQPFVSFSDFMERVDRRKVNKARVIALVKADAFHRLIPNRKWFVENIEEVWKLLGRVGWPEKVADLLRSTAKTEADYSETESQIVAAEVCAYTSDRHPLEPYRKTLFERLSASWLSLGHSRFWEKRDGFIFGMTTDVKYKRVGDYHTGEEPSDEEKQRKRWGATFAQVHLEDFGGSVRVKFEPDVFETYKAILDRGTGVPLAAHVSIDERWKSVQVHFVVAIDELRKKLRNRGLLTVFERALVGEKRHPLYEHSTKPYERVLGKGKNTVTLAGMVTHVSRKIDKRGEDFAFFGLLGYRGFAKVLCFASSWPSFSKTIFPGAIVRLQLQEGDGDVLFLDSKRGGCTSLTEKPH